MMKVIIIKTDGTLAIENIRKGLEAKRKVVGGDLESISLDDQLSMIMYVNEIGKLQMLPRNEIATSIIQSYLPTEDWVAGNALICGCDSMGASCDLTEDQIQEIKDKASA